MGKTAWLRAAFSTDLAPSRASPISAMVCLLPASQRNPGTPGRLSLQFYWRSVLDQFAAFSGSAGDLTCLENALGVFGDDQSKRGAAPGAAIPFGQFTRKFGV
jgi:hypothetical protein